MSLVETDRREGVLTVTLADEARRNALSAELVEELHDVCDTADADPDVRVVVVTNRGNTFCAGANLSERLSSPGDRPRRAAHEVFSRFARSPKPYVGRIAGHCVAGGMGLAAAMDISVAVDTATFGFSEVRIGVAPAIISVVCLPKMRTADARATFLRGQRFSAAEAQRMGLVNAAVPAGSLDDEIDAIVTDLLAASPSAIAIAKQVLDEVPGLPVDEAFARMAELSLRQFTTDEAKEGMRAFLEKRPAAWVRPLPGAGT